MNSINLQLPQGPYLNHESYNTCIIGTCFNQVVTLKVGDVMVRVIEKGYSHNLFRQFEVKFSMDEYKHQQTSLLHLLSNVSGVNITFKECKCTSEFRVNVGLNNCGCY